MAEIVCKAIEFEEILWRELDWQDMDEESGVMGPPMGTPEAEVLDRAGDMVIDRAGDFVISR